MRFVSDDLKSRKFPKFNQDMATIDAHGMFIITPPTHLFICSPAMAGERYGICVRVGIILAHRRGFLRCSFYWTGQCESLKSWDGQQVRLLRFLII